MKKPEKNKLIVQVGRKVVELRRKAGMSQEELAYESDISLSSISKLERGQLNISIVNLLRIAKVLRVDVRDLFNL